MHHIFGTFREVFGVLARRLGTAASAYLVGLGIPSGSAEQAVLAASVLVGVGIDLIASKLHEQRVQIEAQ